MRSLLAALLGTAVLAVPAHADSVVYVKDGNVFVADADFGNPHQVTTDGSTSNPDKTAYRSPSEADDGTIVAAKGGELWRMTQNGTVLNHFIPDTHAYPLTAAVSPDGRNVAYSYESITQCTVYQYSCGYYPQAGSDITPADGSASNTNLIGDGQDGQWIDNTSLVLQTDSSYVDYQTPSAGQQHWFVPDGVIGEDYVHQPSVSTAGGWLAVVLRPVSKGGYPSAGDVLRIYRTSGPPPAAPTLACSFTTTDPGGFSEPVFARDGASFYYYDSAGEKYAALDAKTCKDGAALDLSGAPAAVAGASQGNVSSAPNAPKAATGTGGTGGTGGSGGTGSSGGGSDATPTAAFPHSSATVRRGKRLAVPFTISGPGRVAVTLVRHGKTAYRESGTLARGGRGRLAIAAKRTKRLAPGRYTLKLRFTAKGASTPVTTSIPVTVQA